MEGGPFETLIYKKKFLKKVLEKKRKIRTLKQSHSAEKLERGDLLGFSKFSLLQNIKKREGRPFGDKKISKKSRTVPKTIQKGDSVVPSGFVTLIIDHTKGGPLALT